MKQESESKHSRQISAFINSVKDTIRDGEQYITRKGENIN